MLKLFFFAWDFSLSESLDRSSIGSAEVSHAPLKDWLKRGDGVSIDLAE